MMGMYYLLNISEEQNCVESIARILAYGVKIEKPTDETAAPAETPAPEEPVAPETPVEETPPTEETPSA